LAEATVFVAASRAGTAPTVTMFDRAALAGGTAVETGPNSPSAVALVGCGEPIGQRLAIVDPETGVERTDGRVGEIWVNGPNVAPGYWRHEEPGRDGFQAALTAPADESAPTGGWL